MIGAMAVSGCFRYAPVPMTSVAPGENVRVRITQDAGVRLVKQLGVFTTQLDGEFAVHGDSVSVTIPIVREYQGMMLEGASQTLYLGKSEVVDVRHREFSRSRTILTSVGSAVLFVALVKSIVAVADPNPGDDNRPPPPPPATGSRIPLRSIPILRIPIP